MAKVMALKLVLKIVLSLVVNITQWMSYQFSIEKMRTRDTPDNEELVGLDYIKDVINNFDNEILNDRSDFEDVFGKGVTQRLGGDLETSSWQQFTWGFARCTSIRIPIGVARMGYGYPEDRRPVLM